MHALGIYTGRDLKKQSLEALKAHFGKAGMHYYSIARAVDEREVNPHRERKSLGAETTFERDTRELEGLKRELWPLAETLASRLERAGLEGRVVVLKVKFSDLRVITRRCTLPLPIHTREGIHREAVRLLLGQGQNSVRLIGVSLQGLEEAGKSRCYQPPLFLAEGAPRDWWRREREGLCGVPRGMAEVRSSTRPSAA